MINTNTYTWIGIELFIKSMEMLTSLHMGCWNYVVHASHLEWNLYSLKVRCAPFFLFSIYGIHVQSPASSAKTVDGQDEARCKKFLKIFRTIHPANQINPFSYSSDENIKYLGDVFSVILIIYFLWKGVKLDITRSQ